MNASGCSRNIAYSCLLTSLVRTFVSLIDSGLERDKLAESLEASTRSSLMRKLAYGRSFCAALLILFFCAAAFAQDPTKVEPTHYKLAFENEYVQVVNVHYGPHEKSSMHAHPGGVVVVLTAGHLIFTNENGKTQEVFAKPGEARWFPPFKHRVENLGETHTAPSISESRTNV